MTELTRCGRKPSHFSIDSILKKQKKCSGKNSDGESSTSSTPPTSPSLQLVTMPAHYGSVPCAVVVPPLLHRTGIPYNPVLLPSPAPLFFPRPPLYSGIDHTAAATILTTRVRTPSTSDAEDSEGDSVDTSSRDISAESSPSRDGFRKKKRTAFTTNQLHELECKFSEQKYLTRADRTRLAYRLGLTEKHVKTWYQNRRTKWKRGATEMEWSREREMSATVMYQQFVNQKNGMHSATRVIPS